MSRKIDARELLAALGGLLVLISLFLQWYSPPRLEGLGAPEMTGWKTFETLDLVLAALAIAAIATGAAALGATAALGSRALLPLGAALMLIVGVQLVSPPPVAWNADPATGPWVALVGGFLVLLGGVLSAARIDVTVNVGARDSRRRVPAVDRRPGATEPAPTGAPTSRREPAPAAARLTQVPDERPAPEVADAPDSPARAATRRSLLDEPDPDATQPFRPLDTES